MRASRPPRAARALLAACGVWMVGLGIYFIFIRPPLLPEDLRYIAVPLEAIQQSVPGLARLWMAAVFVLAGDRRGFTP